jgi:hypothetical protein
MSCWSQGCGGGVYITEAKVGNADALNPFDINIKGCLFNNVSTRDYGGALFFSCSRMIYISSKESSSSSHSSSLSKSSSSLPSLSSSPSPPPPLPSSRSYFYSCSSGYGGGAVFFSMNTPFKLLSSKFVNCSCEGPDSSGGAVFLNSKGEIKDVVFEDNEVYFVDIFFFFFF